MKYLRSWSKLLHLPPDPSPSPFTSRFLCTAWPLTHPSKKGGKWGKGGTGRGRGERGAGEGEGEGEGEEQGGGGGRGSTGVLVVLHTLRVREKVTREGFNPKRWWLNDKVTLSNAFNKMTTTFIYSTISQDGAPSNSDNDTHFICGNNNIMIPPPPPPPPHTHTHTCTIPSIPTLTPSPVLAPSCLLSCSICRLGKPGGELHPRELKTPQH